MQPEASGDADSVCARTSSTPKSVEEKTLIIGFEKSKNLSSLLVVCPVRLIFCLEKGQALASRMVQVWPLLLKVLDFKSTKSISKKSQAAGSRGGSNDAKNFETLICSRAR